MRAPMDSDTYLKFYANTADLYSKDMRNLIFRYLKEEKLISCGASIDLFDNSSAIQFQNFSDLKHIIECTSKNAKCSAVYEYIEFTKLYKYFVPLFYSFNENISLDEELSKNQIKEFSLKNFKSNRILGNSIRDSIPMYMKCDNATLIKFVLQQSYFTVDTFEMKDYRYSVVIYIHDDGFLDIRYDALRFTGNHNQTLNFYSRIISECISWLEDKLNLIITRCEHCNFIDVIKSKDNNEVIIFKQMMKLNSGAAAELKASDDEDYILPFIGEIRELIKDNEDVFSQSPTVKELLINYLDEKEATASYPYIYIKWIKPVESDSYIVKVTFNYLSNRYTLMQHNTGNCKDLGMGRMNDAIEYLYTKGAFTRKKEP